ncbi:MAG: zf-HC2 domain-containing protein [Candidatus Omnitrophica bacterium]|nr:zf-HC2 domain-containing protein [Candidatus Omnitrophota bacterium]
MAKDLEGLIRLAYRGWKRRQLKKPKIHPDEEEIASFLEGKLPLERKEEIKEHLILCEDCAESVSLGLTAKDALENKVPKALVDSVEKKLGIKSFVDLEIILKLKEKMLEVLKAGGEILVGQELVPAAVLRSRNIGEFKDEVIILKDFRDIRLEVRVENKAGKYFNVDIQAKDKQSKRVIKDLRVTLFKEDVELESYLNDSGSVIFEHVLLGKYRIEIADQEGNLASVLLEVRV